MLDIVIGSLMGVITAQTGIKIIEFVGDKVDSFLYCILKKYEWEEQEKENLRHVQQGDVYDYKTGLWKSTNKSIYQKYLMEKMFGC